jgi:hypothetical protein
MACKTGNKAAERMKIRLFGGSGEIRTHGRVTPSSVFKTGALNRSATLPKKKRIVFAVGALGMESSN